MPSVADLLAASIRDLGGDRVVAILGHWKNLSPWVLICAERMPILRGARRECYPSATIGRF